jgi:hypothetical protein
VFPQEYNKKALIFKKETERSKEFFAFLNESPRRAIEEKERFLLSVHTLHHEKINEYLETIFVEQRVLPTVQNALLLSKKEHDITQISRANYIVLEQTLPVFPVEIEVNQIKHSVSKMQHENWYESIDGIQNNDIVKITFHSRHIELNSSSFQSKGDFIHFAKEYITFDEEIPHIEVKSEFHALHGALERREKYFQQTQTLKAEHLSKHEMERITKTKAPDIHWQDEHIAIIKGRKYSFENVHKMEYPELIKRIETSKAFSAKKYLTANKTNDKNKSDLSL